MRNEFRIDVLTFSILEEITGVWTSREFSDLLVEMEFGSIEGMGESDIRDMCLLSLQDHEPEEAAKLVLKYHLGDRLSSGQIANIAVEMLDEKPWEEYADMALHEHLFNVSSLLYMAFPAAFSEPDAVRLTAKITALNETSREILQAGLNEPLLVRLLAAGMDDHAVLNRLFEAQLAGGAFAEAEYIIWILNSEPVLEDSTTVDLISSGAWLDPLRSTKTYSAVAPLE